MKPADILMRIGASHYPSAGDYVAEVMRMGASKRLPSVPTGAVQDITRVFLVHPKAIVGVKRGMKLEDLVRDLGVSRPSPWHGYGDLIALASTSKDAQVQALLKKYRVKFWPGIIGYFYMAQLQGIVDAEDVDLDEALARAGVVPVFVVRKGDDHGLQE